MLDDVKARLGIFYSEPLKDNEVQTMIDGAKAYFKNAGWDIDACTNNTGLEAVVLYCKMAQSTDPALLTNHPVLLSFIVQGRAVND